MTIFSRRGLLWVADEMQSNALDTLVRDARADGAGLDSMSGAEARSICPVLREDAVASAAFEADAQDIDVAALHDAYLRAGRQAGVVVHRNEPVLAGRRVGEEILLTTRTTSFCAPVVVNAAGAWADGLATTLGSRPIGLEVLRRTIGVARSESVDTRWPFVASSAHEWYFRPEGPNLLLSPCDTTPDVARDVSAEELDVALALELVRNVTTLDLRSVVTSWAGLRTFARDGEPVIGFDDEVPNLFWFAGQGGYGIQSAPSAARVAAALVVGGVTPPDIVASGLDVTTLAPTRFRG